MTLVLVMALKACNCCGVKLNWRAMALKASPLFTVYVIGTPVPGTPAIGVEVDRGVAVAAAWPCAERTSRLIGSTIRPTTAIKLMMAASRAGN